MFHKLSVKLAFGSLMVLSAAAVPFAQVLTAQAELTVTPTFSCGPHLRTYIVKPLDNRQGRGIRCVKFSNGTSATPRIPKLAWYGEGNWSGATYRHVGQANYINSSLVGSASDIYGNGEDINNNFNLNLKVNIANPARIQVSGAWNEEWILVKSTNYNPLPRPKTCGGYFDEYKVSDLAGNRQGQGLRCVLRVGAKNTTWFGNGNWGGTTYSHIGTYSTNSHGAGDICAAGLGPICNNFAYGSLKLTQLSGGFDVTGAWSEKWRK